MTTEATLFDLDDREPATGPHVLLPNMSYACGGSILTKQGGFRVGATVNDWHLVGCPDCRVLGLAAIRDEIAAQQGRQADVA